jgi:hypothetical protein
VLNVDDVKVSNEVVVVEMAVVVVLVSYEIIVEIAVVFTFILVDVVV